MYQRRGFTLIELLVVIAIIGILATMVITSLLVARTKAYNATAQSDVTEMNKGVQLYETDDTNPSQAAPEVWANSAGDGAVNALTGAICAPPATPLVFSSSQTGFCAIFSGTQNVTAGSTATGITKTATGTSTTGAITYSIATNGSGSAGPVGASNNHIVTGYIVSTNLLTTGSGSNLAMYYKDGMQYTTTTPYTIPGWSTTAQY